MCGATCENQDSERGNNASIHRGGRSSLRARRSSRIAAPWVLVPRARLSIFAKFHRGRDDEDPPALLARSGHGIVANLAPNADLLGNLVNGDFALELPDSTNRKSR